MSTLIQAENPLPSSIRSGLSEGATSWAGCVGVGRGELHFGSDFSLSVFLFFLGGFLSQSFFVFFSRFLCLVCVKKFLFLSPLYLY